MQAIVHRKIKTAKYSIRSHRTIENRGLLTQAIHNAVLEETQKVSWIPFLFFPDGVTYFAPKAGLEPDTSNLAEVVKQSILQTTAKDVAQLFYRQGKGFITYQEDIFDVADVETAVETLIRRTFTLLSDTRQPVSGERRKKILQDYPDLKDLDWQYPTNIQVDRLAEGMRGLVKALEDYYKVSTAKATDALIDALEISEYRDSFYKIPPKGGTPHGWYYLAGHYLRQNSLNDAELESLMLKAVRVVLQDWDKPESSESFGFLSNYIEQVLELKQVQSTQDFLAEFNRYQQNKVKGRREKAAMCAICNSAFESREENTNYTNKSVTSVSTDAERGICSICQVERLLRQYSLNKSLSADDKTIYLHLYPDYFFTPETAAILDRAYRRFVQSNFSDINKELSRYKYAAEYVPRADIFKVNVELKPDKKPLLDKVEYPRGQMQGYYLLGVPYLGEARKFTDTKAWYMAALLGLMAPVIFGVKVVASRVTLPPYNSGADFRETVLLDGIHAYWQHGMRKVRFRLDELETAIPAALSIYTLTAQAYLDGQKRPAWNSLNSVAQALDTSPLYVFHYADRILEHRKKRKSKVKDPSIYLAEDLLLYHKLLSDYYGGDDLMQMISNLVDKYACFYRAKGFAAYARLRPLNEVAKRVLESPPQTCKEDLQLMLEGYLLSLVDRVLDKKVDGFIPKGAAKDKIQLVSDFAQYFLDQVFYSYCRGERSLLRQNVNLIRHAAEAYYIKHYLKKADEAL